MSDAKNDYQRGYLTALQDVRKMGIKWYGKNSMRCCVHKLICDMAKSFFQEGKRVQIYGLFDDNKPNGQDQLIRAYSQIVERRVALSAKRAASQADSTVGAGSLAMLRHAAVDVGAREPEENAEGRHGAFETFDPEEFGVEEFELEVMKTSESGSGEV